MNFQSLQDKFSTKTINNQPVSKSPHFVLKHLLVDPEVSVGVEVVVLTRHLRRTQF